MVLLLSSRAGLFFRVITIVLMLISGVCCIISILVDFFEYCVAGCE